MIIGEFTDVYPPELDGVGTVVRNYVEQFGEKGHECYYIAPKTDKVTAESLINDDLNVIDFKSIPMYKEAYRIGLPMLDMKYKKQVKEINFDIVHAHSPFLAGGAAAKIAKERNIPLVGTFHSKYYDDFYAKTHSELIAKFGTNKVISFFNKCDEVWTVNEPTAEVLRNYGYQKEIYIVGNGTNLWFPTEQDRLEAQEKYNLGNNDVFLFVGQHNFKKNLHHIIEALAVYKKTHSNFKMMFVGQGPDADKMKELVRELGLEDVTVFAGHIMDRNLLMKIFARADLFIFPSLYDNASLVIREAAASGTPSIVMRGSCTADGITDGENGFLCDDSPESIAECMEKALPKVKEVGEKARETLPIRWSTITDRAYERYLYLIDKKKNSK